MAAFTGVRPPKCTGLHCNAPATHILLHQHEWQDGPYANRCCGKHLTLWRRDDVPQVVVRVTLWKRNGGPGYGYVCGGPQRRRVRFFRDTGDFAK